MLNTPYRFDTFFRAYEQHMVNFPKGRAFRKQWNIAFTAGENPDGDYLRIGLGFRLSHYEHAPSIEEYLEFREQVRRQSTGFDAAFQALGNYYEFWDSEVPEIAITENADNALSLVVINDDPPLNGWRFFGKRLWVCEPQNQTVINSHEGLRETAIAIFDRIQRAGFGM